MSLEALDEVVREYLVFRGFFSTLRAFDADVRASPVVALGTPGDPGGGLGGGGSLEGGGVVSGGVSGGSGGGGAAVAGGFQVDRVIEALSAAVAAYDLPALLELWAFLDARFFSRLEDAFFRTVKRFELCLLRHYLVNAYVHHRRDKIVEFFDLCANDIGTESADWQPWFALPFLKKAESDPYFEPFFSKPWLEVFTVSLHNFLQTVFNNLPLPALMSFNAERMRMRSLEAEGDSLRRQVDLLTAELNSLVAEDSVNAIASPDHRRAATPPLKQPAAPRRRVASDSNSATVPAAIATPPVKAKTGALRAAPEALAGPSSLGEDDAVPRLGSTGSSGAGGGGDAGGDVGGVPAEGMSASSVSLMSQDVFADHDAPVVHVKFSAAGSLVVSVDSERTVRLWSPGTGKSITTAFKSQLANNVTAVEWGSKSEKLCFLGTDAGAAVRVFNAEARQFVHDFVPTPGIDPTCPPIVCTMLANPVEPMVVASYASTSPLFATPAFARRQSKAMASVAPLNKDGMLFGWNLRALGSRPSFALPVGTSVKALAFNHNGQLLAFGDGEGAISILDMRSLSSVAAWTVPSKSDVVGLAFSFDETLVSTVTGDGKIAQWSLRTGHPLVSEGVLTTKDVPLDPRVVFSADSNLVLSTFARPHAQIHEAKTGQEIVAISGHSAAVLSADWSAARSAVVTGSADRTVRLSKLLLATP